MPGERVLFDRYMDPCAKATNRCFRHDPKAPSRLLKPLRRFVIRWKDSGAPVVDHGAKEQEKKRPDGQSEAEEE